MFWFFDSCPFNNDDIKGASWWSIFPWLSTSCGMDETPSNSCSCQYNSARSHSFRYFLYVQIRPSSYPFSQTCWLLDPCHLTCWSPSFKGIDITIGACTSSSSFYVRRLPIIIYYIQLLHSRIYTLSIILDQYADWDYQIVDHYWGFRHQPFWWLSFQPTRKAKGYRELER